MLVVIDAFGQVVGRSRVENRLPLVRQDIGITAVHWGPSLYDLTDRRTEYGLNDNAAFQLFSGRGIVHGWHTIDHTKIQKFRSRLAPETQRTLANALAKFAVELGFADARETDFDSTVQEANIAYPVDANLMTKPRPQPY